MKSLLFYILIFRLLSNTVIAFKTHFPISIQKQILDWRRDKCYRGLSFGEHESEPQKEMWEINAKRNVKGMDRQKYENNGDELNFL